MSRRLRLTIIGLALILSSALYIWKKNKIDVMTDELAILESKQRELMASNREIKIALERLSRSERIKEIATKKLNMYTPDPETLTVKIDEDL
jgi:cell division protein FtsL